MKNVAKNILVIALLLSPVIAFSQEQVKIVVRVSGQMNENIKGYIKDRIVGDLVKNSDFVVVDQLADDNDEREMGSFDLNDAQLLCVTNIQDDGFDGQNIVCKLIDAETKQIYAQTEWRGALNNVEQLADATDKICVDLQNKASNIMAHVQIGNIGNMTSTSVTCYAEASKEPIVRASLKIVCRQYYIEPMTSHCGPSADTYIDEEMSCDELGLGSNGTNITDRGFVWAIQPMPTKADNYISSGAGCGKYSATLSGLTANVTYYVRAYATNKFGTTYSQPVQFSIEPEYLSLPVFMYDGHTYKIAPDPCMSAQEGLTYASASNYCENMTAYGFSDWRIPTVGELRMMFFNRKNIGGFFDADGEVVPCYFSEEKAISWKDGKTVQECSNSILRNTGYLYPTKNEKRKVAHVRPIRLDH